ncbi:MAG: hypothetical protein ABI261_06675 [Ginsengibacter sp.]
MKYIFIILLFPLQIFAQDISGVWKGHMYNDTTKENIQYELAISEFDGKLDGYSRTIFIIDSVKNIGVKSIKIKLKEGQYFIVDDKLIYNNYNGPSAKGVKESSVLTLSENDSAEVLSGKWSTNATKIYKPLTGTIFLEKKKNAKPEESAIVTKLVQLGLTKNLSFLTPPPKTDNSLAINSKPEATLKPTQVPEEPKLTKKEEKVIKEEKQKEEKAKEETAKSTPVVKKEIPPAPPPPAAADIAKRIITNIRTVEIAHDTLVFSLFDNGTVDGDTVSILLNGKVIMPRVGLLVKAVNKTIYLTPEMGDSIRVVMYAENLGSIPPNTGLLTVRDGDRDYEILFSGDLERNAEIILVRKKKK